MRWREKFQLLALLFRGKKKKKMLKNGRAKPEVAQEDPGKGSEDPQDIPKKEVTWCGYGTEDQASLQPSSYSTEQEDEVFEEESFPTTSNPPADHPYNYVPVVASSTPNNLYPGSDSPQGLTVKDRIPSIIVEDSNHQLQTYESTPQGTSGGGPTVGDFYLRRNRNELGSSALPDDGIEIPKTSGYKPSADSSDYDKKIKGYRGVRRRKNVSHIKVKYTKVYGESDGAYRNDSTPRGLVFMANISQFDGKKYGERKGSETDFENMFHLFQQMGYDVNHRRGKFCQTGRITKKDFMETLTAFSQDPKHKRLCSCIIIIMSHGSGPKTFITSDNEEVDLMDVYGIFDNVHCEYLRGKPKLFILQFCRNISRELPGRQSKRPSDSLPIDAHLLRMVIREEVQRVFQSNEQEQQHWDDWDTNGTNINPQSPIFLAIEKLSRNASESSIFSPKEAGTAVQAVAGKTECPGSSDASDCAASGPYQFDTRNVIMEPHEGVQRYSDMYSIFSSSSGELSHRDPRKGSLLIQAICHVFADWAYQEEIESLVRKVSKYMTKTLQKDDPITVPRQTCERTNNGLDKYFYFNPQEFLFLRNVTI
ncbi:uncharacterized protein [Panulirus ornatus]|uniref:uncharacterized protein n=1 Tax=Panulirus ornatus TaxID=150431 RepID=UPI003A83BA20